MASTINASTSGAGGLITTADNTGNLNIQSGGSTVLGVTSGGVAVTGTLTQSGNNVLTSASLGSSAQAYSANLTEYASTGVNMRNRIINGDMRIDQRNAGASVTGNDGVLPIDRYFLNSSQSSKCTAQQNAGSVTPPAGFTNYLGITSSSSYSILSSDYFQFQQKIEGYNIADLAWGTANAKTITISFWVRSSLTGTFGGSIRNSTDNYAYCYSYTISSANTWEYKTITISGPTSGTWLTTNGTGIDLRFSYSMGSTYTGTAGSWGASSAYAPTGQVNVLGTNGATWYITGVQLEVGSTATPFERRLYGTELALCQRYFNTSYATGTATGTITTTNCIGRYVDGAGNWSGCTYSFPVQMRTTPSITIWGVLAGATTNQISGDSTNKTGNVTFNGTCGFFGGTYNVLSGSGEAVRFHYTASSEL